MVEERILERSAGMDIGAVLLEEYMEIKGELGPLEKRLGEVGDRLRDLVTEYAATSWTRFVVALSTSSPASVRSTILRDWLRPFPAWRDASLPQWMLPNWRPACGPGW